jgi:hypothetical protein
MRLSVGQKATLKKVEQKDGKSSELWEHHGDPISIVGCPLYSSLPVT